MSRKKQSKDSHLGSKVMLSLNHAMIERARTLIPEQAKASLSGSATLSSVLRSAISEGLDIMETDLLNK